VNQRAARRSVGKLVLAFDVSVPRKLEIEEVEINSLLSIPSREIFSRVF
jgi:hypothetical protein